MSEITYEIIEHIETVSNLRDWTLEVNRISWNGKEAKIDIRRWNADHTKMSRGITFTEEDARLLGEVLIRL